MVPLILRGRLAGCFAAATHVEQVVANLVCLAQRHAGYAQRLNLHDWNTKCKCSRGQRKSHHRGRLLVSFDKVAAPLQQILFVAIMRCKVERLAADHSLGADAVAGLCDQRRNFAEDGVSLIE